MSSSTCAAVQPLLPTARPSSEQLASGDKSPALGSGFKSQPTTCCSCSPCLCPSHGCPLRCPCQRGPVPFLGHFLMELWVVQMPQPLWRERPCLPLSVLRHRLSAQRLHLSCHLRLSSLAPFSHPSQVLARLDWPLRPRPAPCLGPWLTQLCLPGLPNLGRTLRSWTLD